MLFDSAYYNYTLRTPSSSLNRSLTLSKENQPDFEDLLTKNQGILDHYTSRAPLKSIELRGPSFTQKSEKEDKESSPQSGRMNLDSLRMLYSLGEQVRPSTLQDRQN